MKMLAAAFYLALIGPVAVVAQEPEVQWQRGGAGTEIPVTVFHSVISVNLPTAETLRQGEWQFEISHRFGPPVSTGIETLWGLDGPVYNRFGLAYAFHDRVLATFQRSNLQDNYDLNVKVRLAEGGRGGVPWMLAGMGGVAWNTEVFNSDGSERDATDSRNWQYYAVGIANVLLWDRFALGVLPSYLYNPRILADEREHALYLGFTGQYYVASSWSILAEWNISEPLEDFEYDAATFGIELETGGHFFKLALSNSERLNPAQFLPGTPHKFKPDEWRLGFNITRLLRFWGT